METLESLRMELAQSNEASVEANDAVEALRTELAQSKEASSAADDGLSCVCGCVG